MGYIAPGGKSFRVTILALFLGSFVTFADLYSTQPIIPLFAKEFGVTPAVASLTLSFCTGMLSIFLIVVSFFSDNMDRKKMMGIALTLSSLLSICVAFTNLICDHCHSSVAGSRISRISSHCYDLCE